MTESEWLGMKLKRSFEEFFSVRIVNPPCFSALNNSICKSCISRTPSANISEKNSYYKCWFVQFLWPYFYESLCFDKSIFFTSNKSIFRKYFYTASKVNMQYHKRLALIFHKISPLPFRKLMPLQEMSLSTVAIPPKVWCCYLLRNSVCVSGFCR